MACGPSVPFSTGIRLRRGWSGCGGSGGRSLSVPFSTGIRLRPRCLRRPLCRIRSFSPLLNGDQVATGKAKGGKWGEGGFQSPSQRGSGCDVSQFSQLTAEDMAFSPLLNGDQVATLAVRRFLTSVPVTFSPLLNGDQVATPGRLLPGWLLPGLSVPFSTGIRLRRLHYPRCSSVQVAFSPLLNGDQVATRCRQRGTRHLR